MLPLVKVSMPPREGLIPALEEVLYSGMIAEGEYVYRFESEFAQMFGLPNALAMNSGTSALHIALLMAGVGPGDEVITTSMTAEPTNIAILHAGGVPVFADVNPATGNLDPESVRKTISSRTKAICVVHYAGYPADLDALRGLANEHRVWLIEDCAHALGASENGRPIGTIGDAAIFSFQAIKHMTTVDGGVLTLRESTLIPEAKRLRWFGMSKGVPRTEVDIVRAGFKYNMNNVAAVIGLQQLAHVASKIDMHRQNGAFFDEALRGVPGLAPAAVLPRAQPSYWLYTLLADDFKDVERRLAAVGVSAAKLHRPNHLHTVFKPFAGPLPGLSTFYRRLVHLPCGWWVSKEDRQRIVCALRAG